MARRDPPPTPITSRCAIWSLGRVVSAASQSREAYGRRAAITSVSFVQATCAFPAMCHFLAKNHNFHFHPFFRPLVVLGAARGRCAAGTGRRPRHKARSLYAKDGIFSKRGAPPPPPRPAPPSPPRSVWWVVQVLGCRGEGANGWDIRSWEAASIGH